MGGINGYISDMPVALLEYGLADDYSKWLAAHVIEALRLRPVVWSNTIVLTDLMTRDFTRILRRRWMIFAQCGRKSRTCTSPHSLSKIVEDAGALGSPYSLWLVQLMLQFLYITRCPLSNAAVWIWLAF